MCPHSLVVFIIVLEVTASTSESNKNFKRNTYWTEESKIVLFTGNMISHVNTEYIKKLLKHA